MRLIRTGCIVGGLMIAASSQALTGTSSGDNPYSVIADRNVFRLNPVPEPKPVAEEKPKDLPKVYLSGILKIGENVRVLLNIPAKDAKNPAAYSNLAPGEKDNNDVELVSISQDQQAVDIIVAGTKMTLTMASNTLAASGIRPQSAAPGPTPVNNARPGFPGQQAAAGNQGGSTIIVGGGGNSASSPYGGVTVAGGGGSSASSSGVMVGGGGGGNYSGGGVSVSGGGSSTPVNNQGQVPSVFNNSPGGSAQVNNPAPSGQQLTPDEQKRIIAIQYANGLGKNGHYPPPPPPVTALINNGQ